MTTTEPLTKTTSFGYQAEVIAETKDCKYYGLFMEQGTGKTHVTIATFTHLYFTGKINGVLILAPNGVHDNWHRNEIPLHCSIPEGEMQMACWHGSDGAKKKAHWGWVANGDHSLESDDSKFVILMTNIEAVRTDAFMKSIQNFCTRRKFMLVVDESTTIKNPKAEQTKQVMKIAKYAAYTRILTGTPITQSPLDLWAQCRVLNENALPYPSYTAFKKEFAIEQVLRLGHRAFNKVVGYQNQALLAHLIKGFTVRILKSECLDLPEKIYQTRYVELTPEQRRIYKDLVKSCLAQVQPGIATVTEAITMMLRLHQVTLGYIPTDDGVIRPIEHNRIRALLDLVDTNPSKAIIFCRFKEDVNQVVNALQDVCSEDVVRYTGDESSAQRTLAVDCFQKNLAGCRYFVATSAAARGLTLTAAEQVIYYSQGFSLETRLQSEDRAHRIGQKKNVVYTDLVAQGTVEDRIIAALKDKKCMANAVLDRAQLEDLITLID